MPSTDHHLSLCLIDPALYRLQLSAAELEAYFRAFMSKIMFCDHELKPNPPGAKLFSCTSAIRPSGCMANLVQAVR